VISGFDHVVITVADVEQTLHFYETVLGGVRQVKPDRPASISFGAQKINIHQVDRTFEPKAHLPTAGSADFCLVAARPINEVMAHLQSLGVAIEVGPVPRSGARGRMTSIYFRDPDNNLVEVGDYGDAADRPSQSP